MGSKYRQGDQLAIDGVIRIVFVVSGIPRQYTVGF